MLNVLRSFVDSKWHPRPVKLCTHNKPEEKKNRNSSKMQERTSSIALIPAIAGL